jgi:dihydropteroate synthase
MHYFSLIQFADKASARDILREINYIRRSSIYQLNAKYYFVIADNHSQFDKYKLNNPTIAETELYHWAISEINSTTEYIKYEEHTIPNDRGLTLTSKAGYTITRCLEPLTEIFGILNYNIDSFSDGGKFVNVDAALTQAIKLINCGSTVIDLGVEATNPKSVIIDANTEINRLKTILPQIIALKKEYQFLLSIDSYHPETIKWVLDYDVDFINDVTGNIPPELVTNISNSNRKYIAMHSLVVPTRGDVVLPNTINPLTAITTWANNKIRQFTDFDIDLKNIVFDPGIGFGKTAHQSWYILQHISELQQLPTAILVGHSRKSFINGILPHHDKDLVSAIVSNQLMQNDIDYIRVHDINYLNTLYKVTQQLSNNKYDS